MNWFEYSFLAPEENLALDEVLLDSAEAGRGGEILRFWESPIPFVVVGVAQQIEREIRLENCRADAISVQRRCSAGGCVMQGPGSLNYAIVLDVTARVELRGLHESYRAILGRICASLSEAGIEGRHTGTSDLAIDGYKVAGSAQRRRRRFILHHGTLLYDFDAAKLARYIKEPTDRPDYRGDRAHCAFLRNIPLTRDALIECIRSAFGATVEQSTPTREALDEARKLAATKYRSAEWIFRR